MGPAEVRKYCALDEARRGLMRPAMHQLNLNARAYHRILKLARTIADLAGSASINAPHLAEAAHLVDALQYRRRQGERGGEQVEQEWTRMPVPPLRASALLMRLKFVRNTFDNDSNLMFVHALLEQRSFVATAYDWRPETTR